MAFIQYFKSSLGKKYLMGVTGLMLLGFVLMHLAGNLLIFAGPDALNSYAVKLRHLGGLLWVARAVLLGAALLHIRIGILLAIENKNARPIPYQSKTVVQTTVAARTMVLSGLLVLSFVIYHLLHFTFLVTHPVISHLTDARHRHDVYSMVVLSFKDARVSMSYILAVAFLSFHLAHGISSSFQSLGFNNEQMEPCLKRFGEVLALIIFLGYISIPTSVLLGWVTIRGGLGV